MAAKTESDYESDEEFEERTSENLSRFYFGNAEKQYFDAVVQLVYELSRKRFDRVAKIMERMETINRQAASNVLINISCNHPGKEIVGAPGPLDRLQFMLSHFGDRLPCTAHDLWIGQALHLGDSDRLELLRKHVADFRVLACVYAFERYRRKYARGDHLCGQFWQ